MAGFLMRGRIGGMAGPSIDILAVIAANVGLIGVGVVLSVMLDKRRRFSLSMLLTLMTFAAMTFWSLGQLLK